MRRMGKRMKWERGKRKEGSEAGNEGRGKGRERGSEGGMKKYIKNKDRERSERDSEKRIKCKGKKRIIKIENGRQREKE